MRNDSRKMTRSEALARLTGSGQRYELETIQQYGQEYLSFRNGPSTLRDLFEENRSDKPFIVFGDERLSFEEAWQESSRIAHLLIEHYGVRKGDRVAISMRNYPEWILSFTAATSVGAIAVAMNSLWQPDELAYGLSDSGARVLLADEERLQRLAQAETVFPELSILGVRTSEAYGLEVSPLSEALREVPARVLMPEVDLLPEDDATIFYTSGSTGHPKGVVSAHRSVLTALLSWELDVVAGAVMEGREPAGAKVQPATLLGVPLFHATGSHAVYLASYRAQRRVVCMYKWDPEEAADLIEREQVSNFVAPAAMTGDLVSAAERTGRDLGSLLVVGGGGAPRAPAQVKSIDRAFRRAQPNTGWGMTETNAIGSGIVGTEYLDHPESSGRSSAVVDLRVVDEEGRECPVGERGELQIRGVSVFRCYWNRPEADAETFLDGRWMRTGDVAYLDEEGFLYIVDRIKDMVIRGGENIGCGGVEAAILEYPGVVEASVYGVPDERLGEEVGATVFISDDCTEADLREFLKTRLSNFAIPRYFDLWREPLPRTGSGKILKRALREEAACAVAGNSAGLRARGSVSSK